MFSNRRSIRFVTFGLGIFVFYFYFGIIQEKITRGKYVIETKDTVQADGTIKTIEKTENFRFAMILIFSQFIMNCFFAKLMLVTLKIREHSTRMIYYASSALMYLLAMLCSNMALRWVSYPTQVVGKSAKPIPVIILGMLLGNKRYSLRKYLFVFLIVIGVILFMYKSPESEMNKNEGLTFWFGLGELLIFLSLVMDGLIAAIQERMKSESKTSAQHMMFYMNLWAVIFCSVFLLTGETSEFYNFAYRHPYVLTNMLTLALTGAIGQTFIFLMVSEFGPLPCSVITTTRKFFTVLGSVLIFGNSLSIRQWLGTIIVFSGLFLDAMYSKTSTKKIKVNC